MPEQDINEILKDIYAADPSLRAQENKLREILAEIISVKPASAIDPNFKNNLKFQLIERLHKMQEQKPNRFNTAKFARYAIPGLILIAVIVATGGYVYQQQRNGKYGGLGKNIFSRNSDFGTIKITPTKDLAFGTLQATTQNSAADAATTPNAAAAMPNSTAAMPNAAGAPKTMTSGNAASGTSPAMAPNMRIYQPNTYTYVYKGAPLNLTDAKLDVLKRTPGVLQSSQAADVLKNLDLGLVNLATFGNSSVAQLTVNQDSSQGYSINIDFAGGTISIYQNYNTWPQTISNAPLTVGDIPDDNTLIGIAKDFINAHNINTSAYGDPEIQNNPRILYSSASAADKTNFFVPQQISVLYPLMINGMNVYDQSGGKVGISISIDITQKKVAGLNALNSQDYQSSSYDAVTDSKTILDLAAKGGFNNNRYIMPMATAPNTNITTKNITLELGTPTTEMIQYWQYANGQSNELYVPALIFPIINAPADLYSKNVIVPLIREVLDQANQPPVGIYQPLNLNQSGSATGSSGSGVAVPQVVASPPAIKK